MIVQINDCYKLCLVLKGKSLISCSRHDAQSIMEINHKFLRLIRTKEKARERGHNSIGNYGQAVY